MTTIPPFVVYGFIGVLFLIALLGLADVVGRFVSRGDDDDRLTALEARVDNHDAWVDWTYEQIGRPDEKPTDAPGPVTDAIERIVATAETSEIVDTGPATEVGGEWRELNIGGEIRRFRID